MANLLLLFDTKEKDLARDFKDLLEELNIGNITMMPLSSDKGYTLEEKERKHFDSAEGALFIITPGSERLGSGELHPSSSVSHEMGQAKQKFQNNPECVIYLVDQSCNLPAVDQKAYISFNRNDIRSVIASIIQVIRNLKSANLFRTAHIPTQPDQSPRFNEQKIFNELNQQIKNVLFDISNRPNGYISDSDLNDLLVKKYNLGIQEINFVKRDLQSHQLVIHNITDKPCYMNSWWLSNIGWDIVRLEIAKKKKSEREAMDNLAKLFSSGKPLLFKRPK